MTPATPLRRLFRVRYEMSDSWFGLPQRARRRQRGPETTIDKERFSYPLRRADITIVELRAYLALKSAGESATLSATTPGNQSQDLTFAKTSDTTLLASTRWTVEEKVGSAAWTFAASAADLPVDRLKDLFLLCTFTVA